FQKLSQYKKNKKALEQAQSKLSESLKEQEYSLFVFNELNDANLKENEQEKLEVEYEKLNNTEVIKEVLSKTLNLSDNEIGGILQSVNEIKSDCSNISGFSGAYKELADRITSLQIEFSDILQGVNSLSESVFDDPLATQKIGDRLQLL